MTPEEEIVRAERARQLMEDPLLKETLETIKTGLIDGWYRTPIKDKDLREHIWGVYCASVKFEEVLQSTLDSGKLAIEQLKQRRRD